MGFVCLLLVIYLIYSVTNSMATEAGPAGMSLPPIIPLLQQAVAKDPPSDADDNPFQLILDFITFLFEDVIPFLINIILPFIQRLIPGGQS